jgi:hypothetical protein
LVAEEVHGGAVSIRHQVAIKIRGHRDAGVSEHPFDVVKCSLVAEEDPGVVDVETLLKGMCSKENFFVIKFLQKAPDHLLMQKLLLRV